MWTPILAGALGALLVVPASANPDAEAACASFNLTTKIGLMHGWGWGSLDPKWHGYSRNSGCGGVCGPANYFRWDNGPQGFGDHSGAGLSTQWPSTLNMAASWDPALAHRWGDAMGSEFWNKGTNIQEGPGANIARVPKNGRTFEYISGEDPVLGAALAVPLLQGQQNHVMAIGKHFMLNNQETDRSGVNEVVDEKTMMELYWPAFEAMAKNNVSGYMCAYNRINGRYACENNHTLNTMLRADAGFTGFVVSDWGATHSTAAAINAGLDIDMPDPKWFSETLIQEAIANGTVTADRVHASCLRILGKWYDLPKDKRFPCDGGACLHANVSTPEHKALAREIAAKSTVLLKNDGGLLPLDLGGNTTKPLSIVLIGADATSTAYTAGQGSGNVQNSPQMVSAEVALARAGGHRASISYVDGSDLDQVERSAAAADVAIVFGSAHSGEGHDRTNLLFQKPGPLGSWPAVEDVISAVASVQPQTLVVAIAPGAILTDWRDKVPAILCVFLPGEQFGNALADVIFGETPPQGKLPLTFPNVDNEQGMTAEQWPGVPSTEFPGSKHVVYAEKQMNGYRWYDKHGVAPAFAFGHGLSYGGNATYSGLRVEGRRVSFQVEVPSGGCDTPQVYVGYPGGGEDVPTKVLRGFEKICGGGARGRPRTATVALVLSDREVSEWDVGAKSWTVVKGTFKVFVGSSSRDIRLEGTMTV